MALTPVKTAFGERARARISTNLPGGAGSSAAAMPFGRAMPWVSERHLSPSISTAAARRQSASGSISPDLLDRRNRRDAALTSRPFGVTSSTHPASTSSARSSMSPSQKVSQSCCGGLSRPAAPSAGERHAGPGWCASRLPGPGQELFPSGADALSIEGMEAGDNGP